jgi:hypothetical protein
MGSNRRHRPRPQARRLPSLNPRRLLLVVCEGEETEPSYIEGFERKTRNAVVDVTIHDEHGDPRKLVDMAKREKKKASARAKKEKDDFAAYDEVWCVFDRDQHERFADACQMARDNQIDLAVSNPSFELWLLLTSALTSSVLPTESTWRPSVPASSTGTPSSWARHSATPRRASTD